MKKLEKAAQTVIGRALEVRKDEALLIMVDEPSLFLGQQLFTAGSKRSRHVHLLQLSGNWLQKNGICAPVGRLMQEMNAIIAVTAASISHTDARREACRQGARVITMPAITQESFSRIADMDFDKISRLSRKIADILGIANSIEVTAPNGTHLHINAASARGFADTGLVHNPGAFSNLPAGEAAVAPAAKGTEGELIVDSGMGVRPEDQERTMLSIRDGRAVRIIGGDAALRLRRQLAPYGPEARLVAEFGIGCSSAARICGYALEDEKVLGTIHLALGNNLSFGGKNDVPIHLDAVVYKATVVIDGRKILDNGQMVLE